MEFCITYEEELRDAMPMDALEKNVREMAELLIERVKEARRGNLLMKSKVL
jgi:hypothetical protein